MIFILTALLAEATPLIEAYHLEKSHDRHYPLYQNSTIALIITGIGKVSSAAATSYLLQKYHANSGDKVYNIGLCASTKKDLPISALCKIKKVIDIHSGHLYHIADSGEALSCVDKALDTPTGIKTALVDMESVGVVVATKRFLPQKDICILKIVSDYTDTSLPSKARVTALIGQHIETIKEYIDG